MTESSTVPAELLARVISPAELAMGDNVVNTPQYRVGLARREGPGVAEVHEIDTDIFYVLEGTATLVTGGEMIEPRTVAPHEVRAPSTRGGVAKTTTKGDVIVIPQTVPHWFTEITTAPFVYLVVKSTKR